MHSTRWPLAFFAFAVSITLCACGDKADKQVPKGLPSAAPRIPEKLSLKPPPPPPIKPRSEAAKEIGPGGGTLEHAGVRLVVPPGALTAVAKIQIQRVGDDSLPGLPPGLINVTDGGGGYRLLPEGQRFAKKVSLALPIKKAGKAASAEYWTALGARTFFWNQAARRWEPLEGRLSGGGENVTSEANHFTLMINAIVKAPEHAGPANFNENAITSIGAADPTANVDLIQPPDANNQGDAQVTFPFRLPKGRGAFSPQLSLNYSSANGSGPLGVGWDISVSRISVDTRLGVPTYDGSERFLLDGAQLIQVAKRSTTSCLRRRGGEQDTQFQVLAEYAARVHRDQRIALCERTSPSATETPQRYWEVIQRDGTRYYYGIDAEHRLESTSGTTLRTAAWLLQEVEDPNLNVTRYAYMPDEGQKYLEQIAYTAHFSATDLGVVEDHSPNYELRLSWDCTTRPDMAISARFGFMVKTRCRATKAAVSLLKPPPQASEPIRSYVMQYDQSAFDRRTLLKSVQVKGRQATGNDFYEHKFDYTGPEYSYAIDRPGAAAPCALNEGGRFCTTQKWPLDSATFAGERLTRPAWLLDFTDEENYQLSQSGGVSFKWGAGEGANAGCTVGGTTGVSLEFPEPRLRLMDVNGDGLADRIWEHGNGQLRVALGDPQTFFTPSDDGSSRWSKAGVVGISYLESQGAFGASQSADARCGIGPASTSTSMAFSLRLSAAGATMVDADGDGRVDLLSGDTYYRGLPARCRDGTSPTLCGDAAPPPPICGCTMAVESNPPERVTCADGSPVRCAGGVGAVCVGSATKRCPDGMRACKSDATLCFEGPDSLDAHNPGASLVSTISASTSRAASARQRSPAPRAIEPAPRSARSVRQQLAPVRSESRGGTSATALPIPGRPPQPQLPPIAVPGRAAEPVCEALAAETNWGPYTSARRRMEKESGAAATLDPALTAIRWDAQHTGTVRVRARIRRPYCGGTDGVVATFLKVTDFHTQAGTSQLQKMALGPQEPSWKKLADDQLVEVKFGDSLLFVYDTLQDVPISDQGIAIDQVNSEIAIDYSRVCPRGGDCRNLTALEVEGSRNATGQLAYKYGYPQDFRMSELPRYTYWQMMPPLGPPAEQADGTSHPSLVTATISKSQSTETPVHVRLRCESVASQSAKDSSTCPLGTVLKEVVLQPGETGDQTFQVELPAPFLTGDETLPSGADCYTYDPASLHPEPVAIDTPFGEVWFAADGVALMGGFATRTDAQRFLALAKQHTKYCAFGGTAVGEAWPDYAHDFFAAKVPSAEPAVTEPEQQDCVAYDPSSLSVSQLPGAGKWILRAGDVRLMAFNTQQAADEARQFALNHSRHCYVGRANSKKWDDNRGWRHRDYVSSYFEGAINGVFDPTRLLVEVDGENGLEISPAAVSAKATLVVTSLSGVDRVNQAGGPPILRKNATVHSFELANRPRLDLRTLHRVHPARDLEGFRTTHAKQTLQISATLIDPRSPLHLTLVREGAATASWSAVITPADVPTDRHSITQHFLVCVPDAGFYFLRAYTEASFDPATDFRVTASLVEEGGVSACPSNTRPGDSGGSTSSAETIGGDIYALVHENPDTCKPQLEDDEATIAVVAGSEAERLAKCLYPNAKIISVPASIPPGSVPGVSIPAGLPGEAAIAWLVKNGHADAALIQGREDAQSLAGPGAELCCIPRVNPGDVVPGSESPIGAATNPGGPGVGSACMPASVGTCATGGPSAGSKPKLREVPVNLLSADFGSSYFSPWKLSRLVGEVPHSFDPYAGGHRGFFYGTFGRSEDSLACLGPYKCGTTPPTPLQVTVSASTSRPEPIRRAATSSAGTRVIIKEPARYAARSIPEDDCGPLGCPDDDDEGEKPSGTDDGCSSLSGDCDGDDIEDGDDLCPTQPSTSPNGCPADCSRDIDNDGIPNCSDVCPFAPKDFRGIPGFASGCPRTLPNSPTDPDGPDPGRFETPPPNDQGGGSGGSQDCYEAAGWASWICADGTSHPSRGNANQGHGSEDDDGGIGGSADVDGFRRTWVFGVSASLGGAISIASASVNASAGAQYTDRDVLDWNGDGIVDFASPNIVQLGARGRTIEIDGGGCYFPPLGEPCLVHPGLRESLSASTGFSFGASGNFTGNLGDQKREIKTEPDGTVKAQTSGGVTFGLSAFYNRSIAVSQRLDINGDGLPDQLFRDETGEIRARLNLGDSLAGSSSWGGDGLPAIEGGMPGQLLASATAAIGVKPLGVTDSFTRSHSVGGSGGLNVGVFGGSVSVSYNQSDTLTESARDFADVNGDGLIDMVVKRSQKKGSDDRWQADPTLHVVFNLGDRFDDKKELATPSWTEPVSGTDYRGGLNSTEDLVAANPDPLSLSGSSIETWAGTACATVFFVEGCTSFSYTEGRSTTQSSFRDVDGDGAADRVLRKGPEGGEIQVQRGLFSGANLLKKIERPFGGVVSLEYSRSVPSEDHPRVKWNLAKAALGQITQVQSALCGTTTPEECGAALPLTTTFSYDDGYYDRYERESFGYQVVRTVRAGDGRITERDYENRDYWLRGTLVAERIRDAAGSLLSEEISLSDSKPWPGVTAANHTSCLSQLVLPQRYLNTAQLRDEKRTPCDVRSPRVVRIERRLYEDGSLPLVSSQDVAFDSYGNPTAITEQVGGANSPTVVASIDYDHRATLVGKHVVDRAKSIVVRSDNATGALLRRRESRYDDRGNLQRHEVWDRSTSTNAATLDVTPDAFGFITAVTDANGYKIFNEPDPISHQVSVRIYDNMGCADSDAAVQPGVTCGLVATAAYDIAFQQLTTSTDPNGNVIERRYDQFGRLEAGNRSAPRIFLRQTDRHADLIVI